MKVNQVKFKFKGELKEFNAGVPESLQEAIKVLGELAVYEDFLTGLFIRSKREFLGKKKRKKTIHRLDTKKLTQEQLMALSRLGIIK